MRTNSQAKLVVYTMERIKVSDGLTSGGVHTCFLLLLYIKANYYNSVYRCNSMYILCALCNCAI